MYPKWITRALGIGSVLVQNEKEEKQLLEDWDAEQLTITEEAAAEAKAAAVEDWDAEQLTITEEAAAEAKAAAVEAEKAAKLALAGKNGK